MFEHLVRELDDQERRALLVRIQSVVPVYSEPLQSQEDRQSFFIPEEELASLNLLERIIFFFRSLFSRKDRGVLLRERFLKRLSSEIENSNPGLISSGRFQEGMYNELRLLKSHARRMYRPLQEVMSQRRREFVAFLARNDLRDFQERLIEESDPQAIWESGSFSEEKQVRTLMLQRFDELIHTIPQASRQQIDRDAGAFFCLHAFSCHPFDDLLSAFQEGELPTAEFPDLMKPLKELAECLEPLRIPPSAQALYDLFLFLHQERLEDQEFDLENQLTEDMSGMHSALSGIRRFHDRVPLHGLLRLLSGDPEYYPSPRSSIADWYSFYKDFWRQWVHHRYLDFYLIRKRSALLSQSLHFLGVKSLPGLENYRADKFGPDTPVRHELSLSLVKGFLKIIFTPLSRSLKLIYLNGEFFKEENRHAYTDAFLFLSEGDRKIAELESTLGPQGELRAAIQEVKGQVLGARLRQKRISDILARADSQARTLADAFVEQLENLKALLYGILKGQPGDRYDTLVNLAKIGGRENSELRKAWRTAMEQSDRAAMLLKLIRELEINR
ncbi:MAG: hypothetical protein JSV89_14130 [Spirochaetaceae bacterium]|nr:MAG: hypothetical protein JSV89_14130 [Spirochaetaceae bacterium]